MATTAATTNDGNSIGMEAAELTSSTLSLHPKPVAMEDTLSPSSYHRSIFDNNNSSNNRNNRNGNNNRQDNQTYQQEQPQYYPTRPLHLPHPDDPTASLTNIFHQAQTPQQQQQQQQQQPVQLPLAPIFRRPESISTQGATDNHNNNNNAFEDYVLVTPTEEGSTAGPTPGVVKENDTVQTMEQLRVEQSLNCAAAFFGINIESAFFPPQQQAAVRSVTASPTTTTTANGDLRGTSATIIATAPTTSTTTTTNNDIGTTPTKSIPVKIQQSMKDASINSFDPQAVHRRSSAPCVYDSPSPSRDEGGNTPNNNNNNNNELEFGLSRSRPADYVDPKDQHLWRAKYCVLEEGVLYFYRTKDEAESQEAKQERTSSLADFGGGNNNMTSHNNYHPTNSNNNSTTKKQLADLSKSPMASRTCLLLPGVDGGSPSTGSNSNSNSDAESSFMWEKRVALNCVGAVRSAETEYGKSAFELLAVDDNEDEGGHTNKLVLKAPKQEEMKDWIFQFHRALASFVMNMVDLVGGGVAAPSYALGDIHHPGFDQKLNGVGGLINALQTPVRSYNMTALSPRFVRNMPSPSVQSLSHGHGRSQMRRKQPDINQTLSSGGSVHSVPSTPANRSPTELQFPLSNSSATAPSIANAVNLAALNLVTPLKHGGLRLPEPEVIGSPQQRQSEGEGSSPKFSEPELSAPVSANPETERPPAPPSNTGGKYVPPHLRANKYVPPHLRNKGNAAAVPAAAKPPSAKYLPPHQRENSNQNKTENSGVLNSILLPQTMSPTSNSKRRGALLVPETSNNIEPKEDAFFRLGGCADPLVIGGSILDQQYIAKKASRVGHVNTDAHGSYGGRNQATSGDDKAQAKGSATSLSLEWEIGAVSECGIRDSNEDAYFVTNDLVSSFSGLIPGALAPTYWDGDNKHTSGLFAIFDGHCGNQAARFSAERLPHFIYEESLANDGNIGPALTEDILRQAFEKMDDEFCRVCVEGGRQWESGSTALVAMLANEHLVIASIGDCRGVLCRRFANESQQPANLDGEIWNELIADQDGSTGPTCFWREVADVHSPSRQDEKTRIEKAGGWTTIETEIPISQLQRMDFLDQDVVDILRRCFQDRINDTQGSKACSSSAPQRILQISRVCGELAVSRAIGDRDFKAACNLPPSGDVENDEWETSLFLPYPDEHSRQFVGDLVSSKPDFQTMRVGEADTQGEFLVLACDGLWDVMDVDDAVRVTQDLLFKKKCPAKQAVSFLLSFFCFRMTG